MPHQKRVTPAELEAAGPPKDLVAQLRSTTVPMEKKEYVAQLLAALTTQDPSSSAGLVKAGAIGPLVALISTGTQICQLNACSAIASIAANNKAHQQQIVDARWPGSWQGALSSSANLLRPSLRAAIEANSESQDRFFGGAWRHRISRTPRGEENQRYR